MKSEKPRGEKQACQAPEGPRNLVDVSTPTDISGRPWAMGYGANHIRAGDFVVTDDGFTCMKEGVRKKVMRNPKIRGIGGLYIACRCGGHYLEGQLGYTPQTKGALVGLYRYVPAKPRQQVA